MSQLSNDGHGLGKEKCVALRMEFDPQTKNDLTTLYSMCLLNLTIPTTLILYSVDLGHDKPSQQMNIEAFTAIFLHSQQHICASYLKQICRTGALLKALLFVWEVRIRYLLGYGQDICTALP